jgi:hypothetical protein
VNEDDVDGMPDHRPSFTAEDERSCGTRAAPDALGGADDEEEQVEEEEDKGAGIEQLGRRVPAIFSAITALRSKKVGSLMLRRRVQVSRRTSFSLTMMASLTWLRCARESNPL